MLCAGIYSVRNTLWNPLFSSCHKGNNKSIIIVQKYPQIYLSVETDLIKDICITIFYRIGRCWISPAPFQSYWATDLEYFTLRSIGLGCISYWTLLIWTLFVIYIFSTFILMLWMLFSVLVFTKWVSSMLLHIYSTHP